MNQQGLLSCDILRTRIKEASRCESDPKQRTKRIMNPSYSTAKLDDASAVIRQQIFGRTFENSDISYCKAAVHGQDPSLLSLLGNDEIQAILQFHSHHDRLVLALTCKRWLTQVEWWCQSTLQKFTRLHRLHRRLPPGTAALGNSASYRQELHYIVTHPLHRVNLSGNPCLEGCRSLALSPSEEHLAISDIALDGSRERYFYKVILWDLCWENVLQTIRHEIVPSEHTMGGNYQLQIFWLPGDLLVTCSPASICVWFALTGQMLHMYRHNEKAARPPAHEAMMRSFATKDGTMILFVAEDASIYMFDAQSGLAQMVRRLNNKGAMLDMLVCQDNHLVARLTKNFNSVGLLVFDLLDRARDQFLVGKYRKIKAGSAPQKSVLALRVDGVDPDTARASSFIEVLDWATEGVLSCRTSISVTSVGADIIATDGNRFVVHDLLSPKKIMVCNSVTGALEASFTVDGNVSHFADGIIVARKRRELIIGLDGANETDSTVVIAFSLLNINGRSI